MCANIEFIGNFITSNSRYMAHARFLGDVLADKSIGVFIGSSFPGVVGRGKEAGNRELMFNFFVAMEFGTIIKCNGTESMPMFFDRQNTSFRNFKCGSRWHFLNDNESSSTLDQSNDTVVTVSSDYGISFPVTDFISSFNMLWANGDRSFPL